MIADCYSSCSNSIIASFCGKINIFHIQTRLICVRLRIIGIHTVKEKAGFTTSKSGWKVIGYVSCVPVMSNTSKN